MPTTEELLKPGWLRHELYCAAVDVFHSKYRDEAFDIVKSVLAAKEGDLPALQMQAQKLMQRYPKSM